MKTTIRLYLFVSGRVAIMSQNSFLTNITASPADGALISTAEHARFDLLYFGRVPGGLQLFC